MEASEGPVVDRGGDEKVSDGQRLSCDSRCVGTYEYLPGERVLASTSAAFMVKGRTGLKKERGRGAFGQ